MDLLAHNGRPEYNENGRGVRFDVARATATLADSGSEEVLVCLRNGSSSPVCGLLAV